MAFFKNLFKTTENWTFDYNKTIQYFQNNREYQNKNALEAPDWIYQSKDAMRILFDPFVQRKFYKEGKIAIGALVQANILLYEKNKISCPANYIYTTDPYYINNPEELENIAGALYQTKGDYGYRPTIQKLADLLADETERIFAYKLPRDITEGRDVYFTTVFVQREHLPNNILEDKICPMLVLEGQTPDAYILPKWYWK